MAVLDKLMFWKKEDDFSKDLGLGTGEDKFGHDFGMGSESSHTPRHDSTPDIAGTGDLGQPVFGDQASPQSYSEDDTNVSLRGPGFEKGSVDDHFGSSNRAPLAHSPIQQAPAQSQFTELMSKDLEIINAKIDAMRATLENINHRLDSIERMGGEKMRQSKW